MRKVFVYGTLMSLNSAIMKSLGCRGPVRAKLEGYALYEVCLSFPGILPEPGGAVLGELWEVPDEALEWLDRYEGVDGGLYRREEAEVETEDGRREKAFVYVWTRKRTRKLPRRIPLEEQPWRAPRRGREGDD